MRSNFASGRNRSADKLHAMGKHVIKEAGPDAGRFEAALNMAFGAHAGLAEAEDLLHGDDVALHAGDLGDADDLRRPSARRATWMTTWMAEAIWRG